VVSASARHTNCMFYSNNAGSTWSSMATPGPTTVPAGGLFEITAKTFINEENVIYSLFRIVIYYSDFSLYGKEYYLYEYTETAGTISSDKTYTVTHSSPTYSIFDDIYVEELGGSRYLFFSESQNYFFRGAIPASSGSMTVSTISGGTNAHIDVRSVKYFHDASGNLSAVLGHDGGVSKGNDIVSITTAGWENINGFGLTISEFMGFSSSEFDQYRIEAAGIDGNSYLYLEDPSLHLYKKVASGDAYNFEFSPKIPENSIYSFNGIGTRDPSFFRHYRIDLAGALIHDYSPTYPNSQDVICDNCYSTTNVCYEECRPHRSDDIIFAGTDVGVYIWNKDEAEWQCFDTGDQLPYCSVSDIEINYCTMKLRISTFGFGLWETPLPLGSIYSRTGAQPLEITAMKPGPIPVMWAEIL
jgi:hypothetical protein